MNRPFVLALAVGIAAVGGLSGLWVHERRMTLETLEQLKFEQAGRVEADQKHAAQLAELNRQLSALQAALAEAQLHTQKADAELTAKVRELAEAKSGVVPARPVAKPAGTDSPVAGGEGLLTGAETQDSALRLKLKARYGELIRKLGLSPADADRFIGLMISRRRAADDVTLAAVNQDDSSLQNPRDFASLVAASRDDIENDIKTMLGPDGYSRLQQYDTSAGQSSTVARLQERLASTAPLDDSQLQQLQQSMDENKTGHINARVLAQAEGFLSPAQMQALKGLYQQQLVNQARRRSPSATGNGQ